MAAGIPLTQLILYDHMPGPVNPRRSIPRGGWDATEWNFCTSDDTEKAENPPYPIGTKIMAYTDNTNCPGWYTMIYLAFHDFSSQDIIAKCVSSGEAICSIVDNVACGSRTTFAGADVTVAPWYFVTKCTTGNSDVTQGAPICFPCISMHADSSVSLAPGENARAVGYGHGLGWFWCGGVCPVKDVTFFDHSAGGHGGTSPYIGADFSVSTDMRAGPLMACISSDGVLLMSPELEAMADDSIGGATDDLLLKIIPPVAWACCSEGD